MFERYSRLAKGVYDLLTPKLGFPLLFLMIILNLVAINKFYESVESKKITTFIKWIGLFAILYILMLPLGGYRFYRPNILRYDTFMPVTIALFFIYGMTTYYLIMKISAKYRKIYLSGLIIFLLIFTNADRLDTLSYDCEKQALKIIAESPEKIIALDTDCLIMEWRKSYDYHQSELNADLLQYWNIIKEKKLYFHSH